MPHPFRSFRQDSPYTSPYTLGQRLRQAAWQLTWALLGSWTPKPLNPLRLLLLRLFGAKLSGTPFIHPKARIQQPWNIELEHRACAGDRSVLYSLDRIILREGCTIAQEAYLCTGSHDFNDPSLPLRTAPIEVGPGAFVAARAFILPGVIVGPRAIVGANSTLTEDVPADTIVAGCPARPIGKRLIQV